VTNPNSLLLNVLFLAAGFGTRLGETGKKTAKGLFKNGVGQTIIDLLIKDLKQFSFIKDYALVTNNHFYQQYQNHRDQNYPTLNLKIINDGANNPENRLGAIADLILALNTLNWWDKNVLVLPSDTTANSILPKFIKFSQQHPNSFNTVLKVTTKEKIKNKRGCGIIDQHNCMTDFVEKPSDPPSNLASVPFYVYSQKSLKLLKKYKVNREAREGTLGYQQSNKNMDAPGNIIPWLLENNFPVHVYITEEKTIDIGSLEELKKFQKK